MSAVGIIANPSAGKDIRRLVAQGRVVSNQEKSNTLRRVFSGLESMGVDRVFVMPDTAGLARQAMSDWDRTLPSEFISMVRTGSQIDSTTAARAMSDLGVDCIVTLGGDGTNRMVAKGCGTTPLAAISTGTNNVFPREIEGTLAGIAAGAVATGRAKRSDACRRSKIIEIHVDGEARDIALVDAAVSHQQMVGARAVWDTASLDSVFLTRAHPTTIGISSIGARLERVEIDDPRGLYIEFGRNGEGTRRKVRAPLAPGAVRDFDVSKWCVLMPGEHVPIRAARGTIALDGEREIELLPGTRAEASLNLKGPWVVDFDRALAIAMG